MRLSNSSSSNNNNNKEKPPLPRVSSAMRKSMTSSTNGLNTSTMSVSGTATPKEKETPRKLSVPERRVSSVRKVSDGVDETRVMIRSRII